MTKLDRLIATGIYALTSALGIYVAAVAHHIPVSFALMWLMSAGLFLIACGAPDAPTESEHADQEAS